MQRIELEEALMEEGREEEEEKRPHLVNLPSFGASPGDRLFASAVDREMDGDDDGYHDDDGDDDDDDDDDFEFAIAAAGPDPAEPAITADELFSGGRILPSYPLFNLDLLLPPAAADPSPAAAAARSGSISSSSSSSEAAAAEEDLGFCAWAPRSAPQSPERRAQKSASTGSSSSSPARRWRIRDLVVGRSSSDGKDKFHFLSSPPNPNPNTSPNPNPNPKKKGTKVVKEMDMATAHKLYYAKGGGGGGGGGGERGRRSFLPYRQELFGIFASRTHHPF